MTCKQVVDFLPRSEALVLCAGDHDSALVFIIRVGGNVYLSACTVVELLESVSALSDNAACHFVWDVNGEHEWLVVEGVLFSDVSGEDVSLASVILRDYFFNEFLGVVVLLRGSFYKDISFICIGNLLPGDLYLGSTLVLQLPNLLSSLPNDVPHEIIRNR